MMRIGPVLPLMRRLLGGAKRAIPILERCGSGLAARIAGRSSYRPRMAVALGMAGRKLIMTRSQKDTITEGLFTIWRETRPSHYA